MVHAIERFIGKHSAKYRLSGLYIIDSVCRHSKSKFKAKDVYSPRFAKNLEKTVMLAWEHEPSRVGELACAIAPAQSLTSCAYVRAEQRLAPHWPVGGEQHLSAGCAPALADAHRSAERW